MVVYEKSSGDAAATVNGAANVMFDRVQCKKK